MIGFTGRLVSNSVYLKAAAALAKAFLLEYL